MRIAKNKLLFACILPLSFILACSKKVDYSDYLKQSEKIYPGRVEAITVMSGYKKAQVNSLLSSDPRVVKMRLFWNNRRDSIEVVVNEQDYSKVKSVNIPVIEEGMYTFEVITLDAMNHRSVSSQKNGQIYGEFYVGGLVNRVFKNKSIVNGSPALVWFSETDKDSPISGVRVTYPKAGGDSLTVFTPRLEDVTVMVNAAPTGTAKIRTAYLPENALETFYSAPVYIAY
ncbi:MAG: DUF4998 domain-containing protein [Candidatus Pedobacter colombiensis]|uniref:DUF4998 domain-containing protein n=1 Tax=Candidatus Pedobacter colombiensis TaxID=3121371 RepID=A0AAJ6B4Z0_9SPHI|nr:DUF4998 domain-containing protein [Pedobacter sp.]WEK17640.1 MAG: DUF4998 domain-containing protein [Pedobacter sp.]